MVEENATFCAGCGRDMSEYTYTDERLPCPDCGFTIRNHFVTVSCKVECIPGASLKVKDPTGFIKQESITKESHSEKTNRPVTISKNIDRTDPDYTKFHHKVEEWDEHGIIKRTIHEHTDVAPAKHRP